MSSRFGSSRREAERINPAVFPLYYASMSELSLCADIVFFTPPLSDSIGYRAMSQVFLTGPVFQRVHAAGRIGVDGLESKPNDVLMSSGRTVATRRGDRRRSESASP